MTTIIFFLLGIGAGMLTGKLLRSVFLAGLLLGGVTGVEAVSYYGVVQLVNDTGSSHLFNLQWKNNFTGAYTPGQQTSSGTLAIGETRNIQVGNYNSGANNIIGVRIMWDNSGTFENFGAVTLTETSTPASGVVLTIYASGVPPVTCPHVLTLQNDQLTMMRGYWMLNGTILYTEDIPPGESRVHTISPEDCDNYDLKAFTVVLELSPDFELVPKTNVIESAVNDPLGSTNTYALPWKPPVPLDGADLVDSTNGNATVTWSAAAGTNSARASQEGFASMISSQQQFDQQANELLNAIRVNTELTATNTANAIPATNYFEPTYSMGEAAGSMGSLSNAVTSALSGMGDIPTTVDTFDPSTAWIIPLTFLGQDMSINANPHLVPQVVTLGQWTTKLIKWTAILAWMVVVGLLIRQWVQTLLQAPQARAENDSPYTLVASGIALAMAIVIGLAIAASMLVAYGLVALTGNVGILVTESPWVGNAPMIKMGIDVLTMFVPVSFLIGLVVSRWGIALLLDASGPVVASAIRGAVGLLLLGLFLTPASAASVTIHNNTPGDLQVSAYTLQRGQNSVELPTGSYSVVSTNATYSGTLVVSEASGWKAVYAGISGDTVTITEDDWTSNWVVFWIGFGISFGIYVMQYMIGLIKRISTTGLGEMP